jgi:urease alpha subunit
LTEHERERLLITLAADVADGELIEPHPVAELPMAQRYFLF